MPDFTYCSSRSLASADFGASAAGCDNAGISRMSFFNVSNFGIGARSSGIASGNTGSWRTLSPGPNTSTRPSARICGVPFTVMWPLSGSREKANILPSGAVISPAMRIFPVSGNCSLLSAVLNFPNAMRTNSAFSCPEGETVNVPASFSGSREGPKYTRMPP